MVIKYLPEIDEKVQAKIKAVSPSKRNGKTDTMYGYKLEEVIKEYLATEDSMDFLQEIGVKEFWYINYVHCSKEIQKTYDNVKNMNIEIKTWNKQVFPVILRTGKSDFFGIYSADGDTFSKEFNRFVILNKVRVFKSCKNFFPLFYNSGMTKDRVKEMYPDTCDKFKKSINKDWKHFIHFMLVGTDKKPRVRVFLFYDREKKMLYASSIDEYLELIEEKNVRGTLKTRMKLTHTKDGKMKFKIPNPVWLLSEERTEPYWNIKDENQKNKRIKEIRDKQHREFNPN